MTPDDFSAFGPEPLRANAGLLRLQTLVRLRWLAVLGQTATVLVVHMVLGFALPLAACLFVISLSGWLNVLLRVRYPSSQRIRNRYAAATLGYDIVQLTALLYLTGGTQNPFAFLMLAPVAVSASTLPGRVTALLGSLAVISATFLTFWHLPVPWYPGRQLALPFLYGIGIWAALICCIVFTGLYAWQIAREARAMQEALAVTELALAHEQQLSALDGLAAAAAHKLGTPLSTIAVVAKELLRAFGPEDPHSDDVALLRAEAERCRAILAELSRPGHEPDLIMSRLPLHHLIEEVIAPHRSFGVAIEVIMRPLARGSDPVPTEPVSWRNPGMLYGLGNLVENAVDFAVSKVEIEASWSDDQVTLVVADDGPGFSRDVLEQLGEPYVTTRPASYRETGRRDGHIGMGLGFFIAKTLLERSGAHLTLYNQTLPRTGAVVSITWPRSRIDVADMQAESLKTQGLTPLTGSRATLGAT